MKKLYLLILTGFLISKASSAQTVILNENFTTYDNTSGASYNGWTLTYFGSNSFYTTTLSSGPSGPNSYKFGIDSATLISPMFSGADSVHFWMKGNPQAGGTLAQSAFYVYESPDTINWTPVHIYMPPISSTGSMQHWALTTGTKYLKFFYDKDTGNLAFDDFSVTVSNVGVHSLSLDQSVNLYPTLTDGLVNIVFSEGVNFAPLITIFNLLGSKINDAIVQRINSSRYIIDLNNQHPGLYLVKIQTAKGILTRRITIK